MEHKYKYGFATRQIHAGHDKNTYGALCPPIYQTSTFAFGSVEEGGDRFGGAKSGFIYTRLGNPTNELLEKKIASLENGEAAAVTASGMGAISTAIWSLIKSGEHILADETLYGCTFDLIQHGLRNFGVEADMIDFSDIEKVKQSIRPNTGIVYFETPCNPTLKIIDIKEVTEAVRSIKKDIIIIVDNTFATPYLQRPLEMGVDIVVHSATKYLNGHGDVIAGAIIGSEEIISQCKKHGIKDMTGAVLSPFDAFLINRGLKTLDIRMEKHCRNAQKLAEFLHGHPAVKKVYYPGLPDFSGHETAAKQMKGFGGMISIELNADKKRTAACINALKLVAIAVSLGDAETLVEHPASMTHNAYSKEELEAAGISEGLVRMSVGWEDREDIIEAFREGLDELI